MLTKHPFSHLKLSEDGSCVYLFIAVFSFLVLYLNIADGFRWTMRNYLIVGSDSHGGGLANDSRHSVSKCIKVVQRLFKGKEVSHADFLSFIQVAMGIRGNHTDPG